MWSTFIVIEHALLLAVILLLNYYPMSSDELDSIRKRHEILKNVYFYKCVTEGGNARTIGKRFDISYEVHFDNE